MQAVDFKQFPARDIFDASIFRRQNIPYAFLALASTYWQPSEARLRWIFVVGARFFPVWTILGRHPSPPKNRRLVCRIRGSRLEALTAGRSWSLDQ